MTYNAPQLLPIGTHN